MYMEWSGSTVDEVAKWSFQTEINKPSVDPVRTDGGAVSQQRKYLGQSRATVVLTAGSHS